LPPAVAKPQPVGTLPIWPSGLKRRFANPQASHAQPPARHAQRRRPINRRTAIRRRLRRHAIPALTSNDRRRPRPISPTRRPPSTTRLNKRWRISWGGLLKPDNRRQTTDQIQHSFRRQTFRRQISDLRHRTGIRSTGLIATPDEDSAAARLMSAKS
jgi:hypothetical protein